MTTDTDRPISRQCATKGIKKPFVPPITYSTMMIGIVLTACVATIVGMESVLGGLLLGVPIVVLLALSVRSEIILRRHNISF